MRFVTVRELKGKSTEIWKELARERELIITSNGKPIAILSAVSEDGLEEDLRAIRRARATAAVERMQRESAQAGRDRLSPEDIDTETAAARAKRAK